jgi:hypothetical protein
VRSGELAVGINLVGCFERKQNPTFYTLKLIL